MYAAFVKLLNMSLASGILIAVVLVLRFLLRKIPKKQICILWALVGLRLICPFSVSSAMSAYNYIGNSADSSGQVEYIHYNGKSEKPKAEVTLTIPAESEKNDGPTVNFTTKGFYVPTFFGIWAAGFASMVLYAACSYTKVRAQVRLSIPLSKRNHTQGIYLCDEIPSPFILGMVKPKIYLPSTLDEQQQNCVIAHERAHIARRDHWWKPLGFLLLSVHWFNPMVWIAYAMLCRDIEMACDEKVIAKMTPDQKQAYSTVLLTCSMPRKAINACPLAFGEVGVKERVKGILNYRKPSLWIIFASVVLCVALAVGFLSNPLRTEDYIAFQKSNTKGERNTFDFKMNLGNTVRSPMLFVELWQEGTLVRSEYGSIPETVQKLNLTMTGEWESDSLRGYHVQIGTKPDNTNMDYLFQLPEGYRLMDIYSWHGSKDVSLTPDKEVLLAAYIFGKNGVFIFDFDNEDFEEYGDRVRNQECSLLVYAVFPAKNVVSEQQPSFTQKIYRFAEELPKGYSLKAVGPYYAGLYKDGNYLGRISSTNVMHSDGALDVAKTLGFTADYPEERSIEGDDPDWEIHYVDGQEHYTRYLHRISDTLYELQLEGIESDPEISEKIVPQLRKFLDAHPDAIMPTYTYMLLTEDAEIASINVIRKDRSGGSLLYGDEPYSPKALLWVKSLEGMQSIEGVTFAARNIKGEVVWIYTVPHELGTAERIQDGQWAIHRYSPEGYLASKSAEETISAVPDTLTQTEPQGMFSVLLRPTTALNIDGMGAVTPKNQEEWIAAWDTVLNSSKMTSEEANAETYYGVMLHYEDTYLSVHRDRDGFSLREMGGSRYCYSVKDSLPLIELLEPILQEFHYSPVKPSELKGIQNAVLILNGMRYSILPGDPKLSQLESILVSGTPIGYMPACWFTSLLMVRLPSGETKTISVATDSCGAYLSDGVCYEFPWDNGQLYQLFGADLAAQTND